MKTTLHTTLGTGSGTGFSYYNQWASGCNKKAALDTKAREERTGTGDIPAFGIGRILHALLELHYKRGKGAPFDVGAVKYSDTVDEEERVEAERLFRWYRMHYAPDELGKVLEIEEGYPRNKKEAAAIEEAVGISPFTFKPDLVVRLGKKEFNRLKLAMPELPGPGKYLVDHKSEGMWDQGALDRHMGKLQFTAYMLGYNAANPKDPCLGLIDNIIMKYKQPEGKRIYIPLPDEAQVKALHAMWRYASNQMQTAYDWPNPNEYNCFPRGRICYWFSQGICNRS